MTKKKSDKDARSDTDQPESADDLKSIMAIDEDLELLQMTERTLVGPAAEDEETITLTPDIDDDEDDEIDTNVLTKAADRQDVVPEVTWESDDKEGLQAPTEAAEENEDLPALALAVEEAMDAGTDEDQPPASESGEGTPVPKKAKAEEKKKDAPAPEKARAEEKKKDAPVPKKARAEEKKKDAPVPKKEKAKPLPQKNPYKIIVLMFIPVLAALVVTLIFFIQKQAAGPQGTPPEKASQPIALSIPEPKPAPQSRPVQKNDTANIPQTQPQGRPAVQTVPVGASGAQGAGAAAINAAGPARQAVPVTPQQTPATQQSQTQVPPQQVPKQAATTPVVAQERLTATATPDENSVHTLHGINFEETGGELRMKILTDYPTAQYKSFALSNPDRLVIDLPGKWHKPPFGEKKVNTSRISRIRLGAHEDKLRIVADLSSSQAFSPVVTRSPDGLIVSIPNR